VRREQIAYRLDGYNEQLETRIRAMLDAERRRCAMLGEPAREIVDALERAALDGGKRLRSQLMLIAFLGAGGSGEDPRAVQAGAALELLHTGCLVHDDIMDASGIRRGAPSVHAAFERLHRRSGWLGKSKLFGASTAILVGDLAFFHAMRLMTELNREAQRVFHDVAIDVGMGQYLDLRAAAHAGTLGGDPRLIARYKTARYTAEGPLHLGAALVERFDELGPALSAYGRPLGEAYQLRDDLLGAFGAPEATGKPIGDDLRQGKQTLLLSFAREAQEHRGGQQARACLALAGRPDITDADVETLQALLVSSGARRRVASECDALVEQAVRAVDAIDIVAEAKELLRRFARKLLQGIGEPDA
jgi:geranylgeranyl diphosphate synthase, type I